MAISQKGNQAEVLSVLSLQEESILPVAHNEEKGKSTSFYVPYVLMSEMDVSMSKPKRRTINSFTYPLAFLFNLSTRQPETLSIFQCNF